MSPIANPYHVDAMVVGATTDNVILDYTLPTIATNSGDNTWGATTSYVTEVAQEATESLKEENEVLKKNINELEIRLHSLEEKVRFLMEI